MKMSRNSSLRMLQAVLVPYQKQICVQVPRIQRRCFRSSIKQQTDGVYKALTEMRVRTPWIEALRQSRQSNTQKTETPPEPVKPDSTPKKMSDSYFRCVWSCCWPLSLIDTRPRSCLLRKILGCLTHMPIRLARFALVHC